MSYTKVTNICGCGCGKTFTGHPNKKFIKGHKDHYHNRVNPRGYGLQRLKQERAYYNGEDDPSELNLHG